MAGVVIVGASLGGLRCAEGLRRHGYDGSITLVGAEERMPYDRPPLSKEVLAGTMEVERTALTDDERCAKLGAELRLGVPAEGVDLVADEVVLADGTKLPFEHLVVATGAGARTLRDAEGLAGVLTLRTLDDALEIRRQLDGARRVVVVGAGFIGSEVASTCHELGHDVTVLEALPAPLSRGVGQEVGALLGELHAANGVELRCGVGVAALEGDGRVERVRLADSTAVEADLVVVGIGASPNVGWLDGSGLEVGDGVVCDERCRAVGAGGNVWAVGDVLRWPNDGEEMRVEHWSNAIESAQAVAAGILGGSEPYRSVPYVWSDQYGARIQIAGRSREGDDVHVQRAGGTLTALFGRAGALVGGLVVDSPKRFGQVRRLVAAKAPWHEAMEALA